METIFKTNESNKFLTDKSNLKNPNKNIVLANLSIYYTHFKTLNLHATTINLQYLPKLGTTNVICLMDHILFQVCKTRPEIININSNEPSFYAYKTLVNKCSGTCNNINNPCA